MSTILEVKNINKRFGGTQALNNVSISFQDYSAHAIVGENGAGKSTLMSIISGVHKPDSGQVWEGEDAAGLLQELSDKITTQLQ